MKHGRGLRYKHYFTFLFLLALSMYCSGCASLYIDRELLPEADIYREIERSKIGKAPPVLHAKYCGPEIINDVQFHRYMISRTCTSANYESAMDLLLPVDTWPNSQAVLREADSGKPCMDQPAQLYNRAPVAGDWKDNSQQYPREIFLFPASSSKLKASYQNHAQYYASRFINLSVDSSDLKWVCRDKGKYAAAWVLLPFAVAYDIVTSPLLLIYAVYAVTAGY